MTTDHNEAMRLADRISRETDWYEFDQVTWCNEAAALIRKQAERIAEMEKMQDESSDVEASLRDQVATVTAERDTLRAEVERLRTPLTDEQIDALLPKPDGSAEADVVRVEVCPGVWGKEYDEVDAWSKPLVLQLVRAIDTARKEAT